MRTISVSEIRSAVKTMAIEACHYINKEVTEALTRARQNEPSPVGKAVLKELLDNARIAQSELIPYCQDTGMVVVFVELGQEVIVEGGLLNDAINEAIRQAYDEGYMRKSTCEPITRKNLGDNTPAIIHVSLVDGDKVKLMLMAKGAGSENMSRLAILMPSEGVEGIKKFVIKTCIEAGSNPCPPIIVGVGIGGTLEYSAILAKKALLIPLAQKNPNPTLAKMEREILEEINKSGYGPQGLGGRFFALAVKILKAPCHIASLPVTVNINCHAHRHKEMIL